MNVLFITPLLPNPDGVSGGALVAFEQLRILARSHRVTVLSFSRTDDHGEGRAKECLRSLDVHAETVARPIYRGVAGVARRVRFAARWIRSARPLRAIAFEDARMQAVIDRTLKAQRFDVIHVWDSVMGAYALDPQIPSVLTEPEVITAVDGPSWMGRTIDSRRWAPFHRSVWPGFDGIEVFTPRDAALINHEAPELAHRVSVNPFGVRLPQPADTGNEQSALLLFVGGFLHPPNVDSAVWIATEIMPRLWEGCPDARLQLVGADPPARVRALQSARVSVTGRVPHVEPYLARATLVLAPVRAGSGMRTKVLQAMAAGKAVVTTPLGLEGLAVDGAEVPCAVGRSAGDLAAAVAALLRDPSARSALGARARSFVADHHGWEAHGARLELLHDRAIRTHAGRA